MSRYNADGEINLTVTDGTVYTGLHAVDGSINVVLNDGSVYTGRNHPSGAMNAVVTTSRAVSSHSNGSQYIILQTDADGYTPVGG